MMSQDLPNRLDMENRTDIKEKIASMEAAAVWSDAGDGMFKVPAGAFRALAERLRKEEGFDFLRSLTGMDWGEEGLGCVYHLENTSTGENIVLATADPDRDNAVAADVPATPAEVETPKPLSDRQGKALHLSLTRQLYSQNGVPFVYSVQGETYADIAKAYDLFLGEILRFNDLDTETELLPGTVVYLQAKKSKAAKLVDKYVAEGGESLRDIAQRFAVKLKSLEKLNGIGTESVLSEGEMIMLRK